VSASAAERGAGFLRGEARALLRALLLEELAFGSRWRPQPY